MRSFAEVVTRKEKLLLHLFPFSLSYFYFSAKDIRTRMARERTRFYRVARSLRKVKAFFPLNARKVSCVNAYA